MGRNYFEHQPSFQAMAAELPSNVDAFSGRRLRIPLLCEILGNWTDDDHGLTLDEIRNLMAEYFGDESKVPAKPTLIEDLKAIEAARLSSCEIKAPVKGSNSGYRRSRSELSSSQIRMLVHLAQTSKFITEEESRSVCEVLSRKLSCYEREGLVKQVHVDGRTRSSTSDVFHVGEVAYRAIAGNEWLRFEYCRYDFDKKAVLLESPNGGTVFVEKPVALVFSNGCYYLETLTAHGEKRMRRVDRMRNPLRVADGPEGSEALDEEAMADLSQKARESLPQKMDMLEGRTRGLFLRVRSDALNMVYDRFGFDVKFKHVVQGEGGEFATGLMYANLQVSPTFFRWLFGMDGKIKLVPPNRMCFREFPECAAQDVNSNERFEKLTQDYSRTVDEYKQMLIDAMGIYSNNGPAREDSEACYFDGNASLESGVA